MTNKILFIQPFQFIKKNLSNEPLIWFIYLENYLRDKISDILTDVIYFPAENNIKTFFDDPLSSHERKSLYSVMDNAISNLDFTIDESTYICISGISYDYLAVKLITEYLQDNFSSSKVIFGGYHASSCPNDFSYINSPIDYVVVGEGEIVLYNIIKNKYKKQLQPMIIEGVPINNLDEIPPLDLSLFNKYIKVFEKKARGLSISLSRGCPHSCSYCIEENLVKDKKIKRWRAYTPKRAVKETNTLVNYGLDHNIKIYGFFDPCFGNNKKWLEKFLDLYEVDEQIVNHFVETRIDILNKQLLSKLQEKKMFQFYGVETFSKKILEVMNKTHDPTEFLNKLENVMTIHKDLNYNCAFGLITNHPGETSETIQETFAYLSNIAEKDNNSLFNFVSIFYHLFAKTANYDNMENLNQRYGTNAYFPEWWKDFRTLKYGAFAIKASTELDLRESINLFVENHLRIERIKSRNNKKNGLGLFLAKAGILKKQKNELIKFLDENNIEMEKQIISTI